MASGRLSRVRTTPPRTVSGTAKTLHSNDLCRLKINLVMQESHDQQALPQYNETVAGETKGLQRAPEAMTPQESGPDQADTLFSSGIGGDQKRENGPG